MHLAFLLTSLLVVAAPGTGVLLTMAAGLARGPRGAVVAALGCTLGIVPHVLMAVSGQGALRLEPDESPRSDLQVIRHAMLAKSREQALALRAGHHVSHANQCAALEDARGVASCRRFPGGPQRPTPDPAGDSNRHGRPQW
jgi:hypothetical protein